MKLTHLSAFAGLLASSLVVCSAPAQAFSFTTNLGPGSVAPKGNIWLESVTLEDSTVITDFTLVDRVDLLSNDLHTGGNSGAASSDLGDNATEGVKLEVATPESLETSLGNLNLNSIVDTEDSGSFKMNLFFERSVDSLYLWERGMNSRLRLQAIDAAGNLLGNFLDVYSANFDYAGFNIDTREISGQQRVGSRGISLLDLGVDSPFAGVQVTSFRSSNGPDFKIVGSSESVPEPATLAGIGIVAGSMAFARRRKASAQA